MSEHFPSELQQIRNFLTSKVPTRELGGRLERKYFVSAVLRGLQAIVPEEVKDSGILKSPERIKVVDNLIAYQIRVNDRIDFEGAGRADIKEVIEEARQKEIEARERLDKSITELGNPRLEESIKVIIENYLAEAQTVERYIRLNRYNLSFDDVEKYRSVVNAITNCAITAVVLGPDRLKERLEAIKGERNWNSVYNKYRWVLGDQPRNNVERAILIMNNLLMAGQVEDDWYGIKEDRALNIPSFASSALNEFGNNRVGTKEFLEGVKRAYTDRAKRLGLAQSAIPITNIATKARLRLTRWRRSETRERLTAEGRL